MRVIRLPSKLRVHSQSSAMPSDMPSLHLVRELCVNTVQPQLLLLGQQTELPRVGRARGEKFGHCLWGCHLLHCLQKPT